jgi:hypothetical protein
MKYAILIMSDGHGSVIKECNPPKVEEGEGGIEEANQGKYKRLVEK